MSGGADLFRDFAHPASSNLQSNTMMYVVKRFILDILIYRYVDACGTNYGSGANGVNIGDGVYFIILVEMSLG